jgi:hypothetical protein
MRMSMLVPGLTRPMLVLVDGAHGRLYVKSPIPLPGAKPWREGPAPSGLANLMGPGFDPSKGLGFLRGAATSITSDGTGQIAGSAVRRYKVVTPLATVAAQVAATLHLPASQLGSLSGVVVYQLAIDAAGHVRSEQVTLPVGRLLTRLPAGAMSGALGTGGAAAMGGAMLKALAGLTTTISVTESHFGDPVSVTYPPASQVQKVSSSSTSGGGLPSGLPTL